MVVYKVASSLTNSHPVVAHDEVMAEMEAVIDRFVAEQKKL
ncbi:hypothetical protein [Bartonella alsatica]|nr:hypothetical protein [Bartonella alsatica]